MNLMNEDQAVAALAALAQPQRLRAYRLLMQAGGAGLSAGALGDALGMPASTLSFHLKAMAHAGLVQSVPSGRFVIYTADTGHMAALMSYLSEQCCGGQPCHINDVLTHPMPWSTRMTERRYNVLFICTANSARSIMAEAILNAQSAGRFVAHSAGSHPAGQVHAQALDLLQRHQHETSGLRSKDWAEFGTNGAPVMDFVFTVCDKAAGEVCPVWPGQPISAHWGVADPAATADNTDAQRHAFMDTYLVLQRRISLFLSLPLHKLDRLSLQSEVQRIGQDLPAISTRN
jgi:protein-tyrosine-phosphatase/DNA-binding transcriptional ArsR family regulator